MTTNVVDGAGVDEKLSSDCHTTELAGPHLRRRTGRTCQSEGSPKASVLLKAAAAGGSMTDRAEFDRWAPAYHDCVLQPLYQAAHRAVLATANRLRPRPTRLLDVGCGTGRLLAAAACQFPRTALIGVDLSAVMLSAAGRSCPAAVPVRFLQAAVEYLPFADTAFDVVTSTVSFRHWTDPHAGLRETRRVLALGGVLILADVLDPRRQHWISRLLGRSTLPQVLTRPALSAIGLDVMKTDYVPGFGPLPEITVITARRHEVVHRSASCLG